MVTWVNEQVVNIHSNEIVLYKDSRFHAAFPTIIKSKSGHFLLAFRRGRDYRSLLGNATQFSTLSIMDHLDPRSHICLSGYNSALEQIIELQVLPVDPEVSDQDPGLLNMDDNSILLTSFSWYPFPTYIRNQLPPGSYAGNPQTTGCSYLFWGSHASFSNDDGQSWLWHHRYLKHSDKNALSGAIRGQSLYIEGVVYLASYEEDGISTTLWTSADKGKSWVKKSLIASAASTTLRLLEPSLYLSPGGKLVAFMRTSGANSRLATATSPDLGQSWSPFKLHDIRGEPFHALYVGNNKLLLSYGYREQPYGIRCCLVDAELEDIDHAMEYIVRDDAACADMGYPWSVSLEKNNIAIVYYMTGKDGVRYIAASVVELDF